MRYNKDCVGTPIIHKSDYTMLPKGSVVISSKIIEEVPLIDANLFSLENYMNEKFDEEQYRKFMTSAPFFKLNHRIQYIKTYSDCVTVFGHMTK